MNVRTTSAKKPKKAVSIVVDGVRYPLHRDPRSGLWRIRKRTKTIKIDESLGVSAEDAAREKGVELIQSRKQTKVDRKTGRASLQVLVDTYKAMPKRAAEDTAEANAQRLARIVEVAWGKELKDCKIIDLSSDLWEDYAAKRQGGKLDLSTRTHANRGINAAIRMAVSMFHKGLELTYKKSGIEMDFQSIRQVRWLPEIKSRLPTLEIENQEAMVNALPALKLKDRLMWRAIMIARYAGLRSSEVAASQKTWLEPTEDGGLRFRICDRPEEGYLHKTGEDYVAEIISPELIKDLKKCKDGLLVPVKGNLDHFYKRKCNVWLRQFIPKPNKGMHRLRALYATQVKESAAKAARIEMAAIEEARKALGHTSSTTTKDSYLPA